MRSQTMTMKDTRTYLPAAGRDLFLPLYDSLTKFIGADSPRKMLLDHAVLMPGQRVLDIGCGTGTLAVLLKQLHPNVEVIGLDPDPRALARAQEKARAAAVSVRFDQGFSDTLPYPARIFDHVFSSYMFHHLEAGTQIKTLREVNRVLKKGHHFHLLDFVRPTSGANFMGRVLHSHKRLENNTEDKIPALMTDADFANVKQLSQQPVLFGLAHVAFYQGES